MVSKVRELSSDTKVAIVGTLAWVIFFAGLFFVRPWLIETGRLWWFWVALFGVLIGYLGLYLTLRRAKRVKTELI
jgi:hypothetical protein